MKYLYFVVILLLNQHIISQLLYVGQLFRHGARYPVSDIYDGKTYGKLKGVLTSIGLRQQYLLGSYLRKDYLSNLGLNPNFDPTEVQVYTDSTPRCYDSAYAHMSGWFPLGSAPQIPQGIDASLLQPPFQQSSNLKQQKQGQTIDQPATDQGYQPIPIKQGKSYFKSCPNEAILIQKRGVQILPKVLQLQAEQTVFINRMKNIFNLSIQLDNIGGAVQLYDTVACDLNLGAKMPSSFTQKDFQQLKYIQNYLFVLLYAQHLANVYSTPFALGILTGIQRALKGQGPKLTVYSGHDTNVAPMLTFLNLTSADCVRRKYKNQTVTGNCAQPVPFASSIQIQLHKLDTKHFIKIRYNGDYYKLCQKNTIQCELNEWTNRIKQQLVDFDKQCGVK